MTMRCPKCRQTLHELGRYCARCGSAIAGPSGLLVDGRTGSFLPAPDGFHECDGAPGVYCRMEPGWGGANLLDTETRAILFFNGGDPLEEVAPLITALDANAQAISTYRPQAIRLPRGEVVRLEVPSYELPDEIQSLTVALEISRPTGRSR